MSWHSYCRLGFCSVAGSGCRATTLWWGWSSERPRPTRSSNTWSNKSSCLRRKPVRFAHTPKDHRSTCMFGFERNFGPTIKVQNWISSVLLQAQKTKQITFSFVFLFFPVSTRLNLEYSSCGRSLKKDKESSFIHENLSEHIDFIIYLFFNLKEFLYLKFFLSDLK